MKTSARLYHCARCHCQVILCSHCDRGNIYCFNGCAEKARKAGCKQANKRYGESHKGRLGAARRQASYRLRLIQNVAERAVCENKVTDQGSPEIICPDSIATESEPSPSEPPKPLVDAIYCHCCGRPVQQLLRRGKLRQRWRRKSDLSPV